MEPRAPNRHFFVVHPSLSEPAISLARVTAPEDNVHVLGRVIGAETRWRVPI